jgi:hypothetical protein
LLLGSDQIINGKIEVHLLRNGTQGPSWREIALNPRGSQPDLLRSHSNEGIAGEADLSFEKGGIGARCEGGPPSQL